MKSFFTYFLAFTVFLSASFGLLIAQPVSAASPYDNTVRVANTLEVVNSAHGISYNLTNPNGEYYWREMASQCSGFDYAFENGSYSVSQLTTIPSMVSSYGEKLVTIMHSAEVSTTDGWYSESFEDSVYTALNPPSIGNNLRYISIWYDSNQSRVRVLCSAIAVNFVITNNFVGNVYQQYADGVEVYASTFNVIAPPGYDGPNIPDTPGQNTSNYPQIGYSTDQDKKLFAISTNQDVTFPTALGGQLSPALRYTVFAPDGTTVLDTKVGNLAYPYTYQFTGNDTYYLQVEYIHPGPPAALFDSSVKLGKVKFTLDVNGTLIRGGNVDPDTNTCTSSGDTMNCGEANPLEDCSEYGLDIGAYFQCIVNNFGIWLRSTLTDLFVPKYSFMNGWVTSFGDFLNTKLGAVYTSFGIVGNLFTGMIGAGATGKCSVAPPGQIFGATFELNVCKFEQVAGNVVFTALRALVIGLTILALVFALYRKYLEVVDHR